MKTPPMSLADRLELAAQACHAAHLLSCEATCREAATALASLADELRLARETVAELEKDNRLWCANWEALHTEKLAAENDAARYRWLRERANVWTVKQFIGNHWRTLMTDQLDAAIDEAMKEPR